MRFQSKWVGATNCATLASAGVSPFVDGVPLVAGFWQGGSVGSTTSTEFREWEDAVDADAVERAWVLTHVMASSIKPVHATADRD
jgi:hypothetical protein